VDDFEERTLDGLTIRVDRLLCVGFGDCIEVAPEAFEFDDDGIATFKEDADEVARERLLQACERCPVDALLVFDAGGRQVIP